METGSRERPQRCYQTPAIQTLVVGGSLSLAVSLAIRGPSTFSPAQVRAVPPLLTTPSCQDALGL